MKTMGINKENYTKITDMPKIYLDAVISIEDHKFYKHHGVSVTSISPLSVSTVPAVSWVDLTLPLTTW